VTASPRPAPTSTFTPGVDELVIETPERVELYYTRAQVGNRFLAAGVDHLIQILMVGAILVVAWWLGDLLQLLWDGLGNWALGLAIMVAFLIYTSYFVLFETIWNGQTPGKRLFRLRVIREDGRPIRFYEAMVRNLLRTALDAMPVVGVPFLPLYSIGIVAVFLSPRSKRIGDYVAGTVVVRESEAKAPTLDEVISLARYEAEKDRTSEPAPFVVDPLRLNANDYAALRAFLRRRHDMPELVRIALGNRIAGSLALKLDIPAIPLSAEHLLEEVDRQSRTRRSYRDELE
jgi:uncharacterized RDD family membrane protein YckC